MVMECSVKIGSYVLIDKIKVDFSYSSICILGSSGSGKSTFLKLFADSFVIDRKKSKKQLYSDIISYVDSCSSRVILDDISFKFSLKERQDIFAYIFNKHLHLLYVSRCVDDIVSFNYTIILYNHKVAMEGKTSLIVKEEKLMKLLGFSLPFYVDMSMQLGYYGLMTDICYSEKEILDAL